MLEAISYVRWSSQEQSKGNSSDRQEEGAAKWLKAHPDYTLNRSAKYRDEGVSGRGAHLDGALGAFMRDAVNKKFKAGTVLLVEALDRLGRMAPYKQMGLFLTIIAEGITVVTTIDGQEYSISIMESSDGQWKLMQSLVKMNLAWEESEKKAVRSGDNWTRIRRGKKEKVGTKCVPGWIRVSDDGKKYELIPERVQIIREIFQLTVNGWGKDRIANKLNDDEVETWGVKKKKARRWRDSYVAKILTNPSVVGHFQWYKRPAFDHKAGKWVREPVGEVVEDHFPQAIKTSLWAAVQKIRESRAKRPGRVGPAVRNLFTGLVYCGHTGESMTFSNKTPHYYLKSGALKSPKGVPLKPWIYEDFESDFFEFVGRLKPEGLIDPSRVPEREELIERIAEMEASASRLTQKINRLLGLDADKELNAIPEIRESLINKNQKRSALNAQIAEAKQILESLSGTDVLTNEALASIKAIREKRGDPDFRLRLRDYLANLVDGIFVYLDGEAVFGRSVNACFNLARGGNAPAALRLYLEQSAVKGKKSNPESVRNAGRVRAFSIAFKGGLTRTVVITQKKGGGRFAVALAGKQRKIVRENGVTRLHREDDAGRGFWMWEDAINIGSSDFDSNKEYIEFLKSYDAAYPLYRRNKATA
jgi:DNA invertase Pin-like site-specific DNA recombinase